MPLMDSFWGIEILNSCQNPCHFKGSPLKTGYSILGNLLLTLKLFGFSERFSVPSIFNCSSFKVNSASVSW